MEALKRRPVVLQEGANASKQPFLLSPASVWEFGFADQLVLVRPDSPELYILNSSASFAWRLLRGGKDLPCATVEFADHFGISEDLAARDLEFTWHQWAQTLLAAVPNRPPPPPPFPPVDSCLLAPFRGDYHLHGKSVRVVLHRPELVAEIAPRLEPLVAPLPAQPNATVEVTGSGDVYYVFSGGECVGSEDNAAAARVVVLQELVRSTHSETQWAAILHAGACGVNGRCVIFPAESHSGKTTLAVALMHAGLRFFGDDSVPIEAGSWTIPVMPFSLMIREGSWPAVSARFPDFAQTPVQSRDGQEVRFLHPLCPSHHDRARAEAIVFSRWQANASTTVRPLDSFQALIRLKTSGFWVAHDRQIIQTFLDWLQSLPIYELIYSDLDEAVASIRDLLPDSVHTSIDVTELDERGAKARSAAAQLLS